MKTQTYLKRVLSAFLVMVLASQVITLPVGAREKAEPVYLEAATMPEEILSADTFYVGTTSADLQEDCAAPYLLKIGRGGDAAEKASVTLKITDATASYGKDYKVSYQGKFFSKKADNPKGNESLLDIIAENDVLSETPIGDEEEQAEVMQQAVAELEEKAAKVSTDTADSTVDDDDQAEKPANVLRDAKEAMSGEASDRGDVVSSGNDMIGFLSESANSLTNLVQGATLEVDFAAGEAEKYVEITTVDNDDSDGDRIFYVTLAEPSEGYTNSMVSESMFTIKDDEPLQNAVVSFDTPGYTTRGGKLTVTVRREGAIAQTVAVTMKSESGTARSGVEYSPVDAQVVFPFGVTERKLEITTDNSHVLDSLDFSLVLIPGVGTEIGAIGKTKVTIQASNSGKNSVAAKADARNRVNSIEGPADNGGTGGDVAAQVNDVNAEVFGDGWWVVYCGHDGQQFFSRSGGGSSRHVCYTMKEPYDEYSPGGADHRMRLQSYRADETAYVYLSGSRAWGTGIDKDDQYVYDGVHWKMDSNHEGYYKLVVGVNSSDQSQDIWSVDDTDSLSKSLTWYTAYFNQAKSRQVYFALKNQKNKGDELMMDVKFIQPIYRPFVFTLKDPEQLTYYTGNGSSKAPKDNNPITEFAGGAKTETGHLGDHITISYTNNAYARMTGVRMCFEGKNAQGVTEKKSVVIDTKYYAFGGNSIDFEITNDFIREYKDYITFSSRGDKKLKGEVTLQPIYEYVDCEVTVKPNTDPDYIDIDDENVKFFTGTLCINGEKIDVGTPRYDHNVTLTYHYGDVLRFTTEMASDNFVAKGVHFKIPSRTEASGYLLGAYEYENNTTSITLVEDWYELYPEYTEKNNAIIIKIHEDDLKHFEQPESDDSIEFDASKYLLSAENLQKAERSGKFYLITAVDTKYTDSSGNQKELTGGDVFRFAVTAKKGYRPVWRETNDANYFMDDSFTYTAKTKKSLNLIRLYAGVESAEYVSIKCRLFYENLILSRLADNVKTGVPLLQAKDGFLAITGQVAVPDENGVAQTPAFHPVQSITLAGETRTFGEGSDQLSLCTRATVSACNVTQTKDIKLNLSGTSEQVSDGTALQNAKVTDLGDQIITVNGASGPRVIAISTTNKGVLDSNVHMNDESTKITVTIDNIPDEGIKEVNFLVLNGLTFDEKLTIKATKGTVYGDHTADYFIMKTFKSDKSESSEYDEGDMIFVQIVTKESPLDDEIDEEFRMTTYPPMYTGYMFTISGLYGEPTVQSMNIGTIDGLSGLPLVGNFNSSLNLGPVSLSVTDLYDDQKHVVGQRIQVGMELDFDATSISSDNSDVADDGNEYGSMLNKITHLKDTFKKSAKAFSDIRNAAKKAGNYKDAVKNVASMGSPKWGITPIVGFYLDFAYRTVSNEATGELLARYLVCNGGGIYLGVKGEFSVAWYALVPVVFIPCYFGVAGELTISLHAGAATTSTQNGEPDPSDISFESFQNKSHNLSETLHFDFDAGLAATVEIYCGIGICGTLGVRGGVIFDFNFIWYPTLAKYNSYFKPVGFSAAVSLGIWIDLLLFTIPYSYELARKDFGLLDQLSELADMSKSKAQSAAKPEAIASGVAYEVKPRDNTPSAWTGSVQAVSPGDVSSMATYKLKSVSTLLSDGYDRPDAQLMEMGENGTLMVFLQDDKSRTDTERTALSYSVLQDGVYSEPVIIQTDATADFQPNVADAGDNVVITWISSDPAVDKGNAQDSSYEANYLKAQEVYSVSVSKTDLAAHKAIDQSAIVRLTNDDFYDAQPYTVYDSTSGDYNVYYIKSAEDTESSVEAVDLANPMNASGKTYSVIAYRVYENGKGWVTTEYKEKEKPSSVTDEQYTAQLAALGGQRLLSSPIQDEDINKEDPLIGDFKAIGYNGIGVFAYTIDKDMNADTDEDRDLFIQLYDFATRSTYVPIRITDDDLPDAMPQLVRNGSDEDGTTYLFWMSDNVLQYIDVSSLVKYGVDKNGQILDSVIEKFDSNEHQIGISKEELEGMSEEEQAKATYIFRVNQVVTYMDEENNHCSYSDYQVAVDKDDNIYVIWIQKSPNVTNEPNQEVYAAAMIKTDIRSDRDDAEEYVNRTWSDANQLTDFGMYCDEPAIAITDDNRMVMVFNRFDIAEDKTSYTDMTLCAGVFEPYCSIEATEINYSDDTPVAGQNVNVTVTFENTGLTASKNGFTAEIFEKSASGATTLLETFDYSKSVIPAEDVMRTFVYTASESTPGSSIYVSVKEKDVQGVNNTDGDPFRLAPDYQISANRSYQDADNLFYTDVIVTNTGNERSKETDVLDLVFNGRYGSAENYGVKKTILGFEKLSLEPGESVSYTILLDVPAEAFTKYGFIDLLTKVTDGEEEYDHQNTSVYMHQPTALTLNDGKDVEMTQGDAIDLQLDYTTSDFLNKVSPMFVSNDNSIVRVEDGKLIAVGGGTTTVTAYAYPYKSTTSITVTVEGTSPVIDDEEELTPLQVFFAKIKAVFEKFVLFLKQHFGPIFNTIKGWLRKIWEFLCRLVGVKVNAN